MKKINYYFNGTVISSMLQMTHEIPSVNDTFLKNDVAYTVMGVNEFDSEVKIILTQTNGF